MIEQGRKREQRYRDTENQAPYARGGRHQPAGEEEHQRSRRYQTPAQVVEDAPAADHRPAVRNLCTAARGDFRKYPWRDLPVAADPAVLPLAITYIVERKIFEQL